MNENRISNLINKKYIFLPLDFTPIIVIPITPHYIIRSTS